MTNKSVHPKIIRLGEKVAEWYFGKAEDAKAYIEKIEGEKISDNLFVCRVYLRHGSTLFIGPVLMVIDSRTSRVVVDTYMNHQCITTTAIGPSLLPDHDFTDAFNNDNEEETKKMITLKLNNIEVNFEELKDTCSTFKEGIVLALGMLDAKAGLITSGITTTEFGIDGTRIIVHFKGDQASAWMYHHLAADDAYLDTLLTNLVKLGPQIREALKSMGNPVEYLGLAVVTDDLKDHIFEAASAIYSALNGKVNQIPGMHNCW